MIEYALLLQSNIRGEWLTPCARQRILFKYIDVYFNLLSYTVINTKVVTSIF